jgi:hypothetical protein
MIDTKKQYKKRKAGAHKKRSVDITENSNAIDLQSGNIYRK